MILRQKEENRNIQNVHGTGNPHIIRCLWETGNSATSDFVKITKEKVQRGITSRCAKWPV